MKSGADIMISYEDRILWEKVARTVKPMKGKTLPVIDEFEPQTMDSLLSTAPLPEKPAPLVPTKPKKQTTPVRLDEPTHRKIAKGKLNLSARIDLHGLSQGEAHGLLLAFLHRAHSEGLRHILIITGKGASFGSDGVLRQAVPHWFATPAFRPYVSAYEDAARHHGGSGALYVRLRRKVDTSRP
ncbi:MAG: Smr/MutS family protein [Rhizobiaceae bacterium]